MKLSIVLMATCAILQPTITQGSPAEQGSVVQKEAPAAGNTKLINEFISAAKGGYIKKVQRLLNQGIDVNMQKKDKDPGVLSVTDGENGYTALISAAGEGETDAVKLLLDHKDINVNMQGQNGNTALILAAEEGRTDTVKLLLDHKYIKVNMQNIQKNTALITVMRNESRSRKRVSIDVVKNLLKHNNIKVNLPDKFGRTALMWAIENAFENALKYLLDVPDIDVNAQDDEGTTAFMIAAKNKNYNILAQLLGHYRINVDIQDKMGRSLLMQAAYFADDKIISLLEGKILKEQLLGIDISDKDKAQI